jgi:hypothetical protein
LNIDSLENEITDVISRRPTPIKAHTFIKRWENSFSRPLWLRCDDGNVYVVKGQNAGRSIFNDHVVGILANKMGAPVPKIVQVDIPQELVESEPQMQDVPAGIAHGSLLIDNATDRLWLEHTDKDYNQTRFALLCVLYGWLCANDNQLIYSNQDPFLVYSVDHGHFFPNGPDWRVSHLINTNDVKPNSEILTACKFSSNILNDSIQAMKRVSTKGISEAVGLPPDEWGVSFSERIALARFIEERQALMHLGDSSFQGAEK